MEKEIKRDTIKLTKSQEAAFAKMKTFIDDPTAKAFILKGYAGTGKTTLMSRLIGELEKQNLNYGLLASTGRAAKILSNLSGGVARTVHSEIYKFTDLNQDLEKLSKMEDSPRADATGQLYLNFELTPLGDDAGTIYYIIDEASMLSDVESQGLTQAIFGSGRVLHDLFEYAPKGKFFFIGDTCQLPPVGQPTSPALDADYLRQEYGITPYEASLTQIVRQSQGNDITQSAQKLRLLAESGKQTKWATFPFRGYKNIHILDSQTALLNAYIKSVKENGLNSSTLICNSNKQAADATTILRPVFGHNTPYLEEGDLLLVTQNNLISGLMNGDLVVVVRVGGMEQRAGLTFLDVTVREQFTGNEYTLLLILDVLGSKATNISQSQHRRLLLDFYYRMKELGVKQHSAEFKMAMYDDPYLNALRAVYGYSLTCHKSQGGEWDYVFLDIPRYLPGQEKPFVYQWVYTAMTRARRELYVAHDFWVK